MLNQLLTLENRSSSSGKGKETLKTPLWLGILLQEKGAHRGGSALYRLQWAKHTKTHRY